MLRQCEAAGVLYLEKMFKNIDRIEGFYDIMSTDIISR